jgi:hypothetical protein
MDFMQWHRMGRPTVNVTLEKAGKRSGSTQSTKDYRVAMVYKGGLAEPLARAILGLTRNDKDLFADHIDRDPMNNRCSNLRRVTARQNRLNSFRNSASGYKGVTKSNSSIKPWRVKYGFWEGDTYKQVSLGLFANKHEAALVYNREIQKAWPGEIVVLNSVPCFVDIPYESQLRGDLCAGCNAECECCCVCPKDLVSVSQSVLQSVA